MKFGKRLAAEAARAPDAANYYFDYKSIKKSIADDVAAQDAQGARFQELLLSELQKLSQFYSRRAAQLEATFAQLQAAGGPAAQLAELRAEVQELIKYVALNYVAVVKSIKKRNRHLQEAFGSRANTSLHALDLLMGEVFFTSPRLAALATQAEVLQQQRAAAAGAAAARGGSHKARAAAAAAHQQLLEDYTCPVCLDTLHNPVVLTCAHRFCWGCLVAHCTACKDAPLPLAASVKEEDDQQPAHSNSFTRRLAPATSYRVLEQLACQAEPVSPTFYPCPVCRKPQILDVDALQVDTYLEQFINNLQGMSSVAVQPGSRGGNATTTATVTVTLAAQQEQEQHLVLRLPGTAPAHPAPQPEPWGVIPPQPPQHKGKLCVLLDLDGTLVSSFTPKRAPRLPPYVRTHVVGVGSKLNPQGVFVVERPGLPAFLEQLAAFAEVIVFTAGLQDYASPIIDAIDPGRRLFAGRIYREGTLRTEHYQCVKDMARLNRDLRRTVLVDDTPLAFLHQPDNGVPVLGFRGDPDDRLLLEAVLPLLQALAGEKDVGPTLRRRFDMGAWFRRHGFPVDQIVAQALADAEEERRAHAALALKQQQGGSGRPGSTPGHFVLPGPARTPMCLQPFSPPPRRRSCQGTLLLLDFDKTLTDFDAGERVVEALAPELLPMLAGVSSPANFIPLTNTLLAEIQRRGVSRDDLLATLHRLGAAELPQASARLLADARRAGATVKVLSDANSVFITHILAGARVAGLVSEVITNPAAFERAVGEAGAPPGLLAGAALPAPTDDVKEGDGGDTRMVTAPAPSSRTPSPSGGCRAAGQPHGGHKLVIAPCHGGPGSARPGHACSLCPENLCKGWEVRALRAAGAHARIVYAGDGLNDVCAALCLGPDDVVLAREGHPLAHYIKRSVSREPGVLPLQAQHRLWATHEELRAHVAALLGGAQ